MSYVAWHDEYPLGRPIFIRISASLSRARRQLNVDQLCLASFSNEARG